MFPDTVELVISTNPRTDRTLESVTVTAPPFTRPSIDLVTVIATEPAASTSTVESVITQGSASHVWLHIVAIPPWIAAWSTDS